MYDQVVKCQRAGLCLSEHFLIAILNAGSSITVIYSNSTVIAIYFNER